MLAGDLLAERARITPDRVALISVETGERLTYAQINDRANGAAAMIAGAGLRPGDRAGLLAANSIDFIAFFFGALKAGVIVVPLSTRATAHELSIIAADCGMNVLFHDGSAPDVNGVTLTKLNIGPATPPLPHRVIDLESIACLLYTSGTTGKPKGVMIPHRQLFANGYNTAINWGLREDDIAPIFTPLYHAGGVAVFLIPLFLLGGTIVLHRGFDAEEVWETIERERCTVVLGVPTIWKMLLDAPQFATVDLQHVRWFISGGAPLPVYLIDAYQQRGVTLKQGYGLTEVGVNCFTMTIEDARNKPGSIGRPMMFTDVRLVDDAGSDADTGELWLRGPHVSSGYWNNPAATADAYVDGWFRTGDIARRDDDGFFFIAGRRKEMFISGGVNVYPAEVESELLQHPNVSDAAVIAVADETWGEVGVAFVVAHGVADTELVEFLGTRLTRYKIPRRFIFAEALPRTPYGKVLKEELRKQLA
ncbi:MAG: long-chain fatty acid--CoA ligase [Acidobacteria bacterium]|nr:long-chain fatty acid--CoA ligase [Acidobacteriota bacterium]MBV9071051.1 long-chain fatty acid--CoA ligase [Acidobacteriota bacterium]